jgi:site-specific DNA-methyltransferase (adenine-specific)
LSNLLIHGDCIEVLPQLQFNFRLIFADPPYNIGIDYGQGKHIDLMPKRDYENWCKQWLNLCSNKLENNGSLWIMINDEQVSFYETYLREICGLTLRNWITLHESFGVQTTKKFARTKRHLLYFVKNPKNFIFNKEAVLVPSARLIKYNDKRANPKGKIDGDVWKMTRVCGTFKERIKEFPTQLPIDLLKRIISVASNKDDWILDPFSGSYTTGITAKMLGRKSIGIELNERFYQLSKERLEKCQENS